VPATIVPPLVAVLPEVVSVVADGPHSAILQQVTNGVAVRMAVLDLLADQPAGEQ